jgi:purine-nucleoside phosphorylase
VIVANHMGIRCLAMSCVTNLAAGISPAKLSHAEVMETGERVRGELTRLLRKLLPRMADAR